MFCIINITSIPKDVAEFYVIPVMRRQQIGMKFARIIIMMNK